MSLKIGMQRRDEPGIKRKDETKFANKKIFETIYSADRYILYKTKIANKKKYLRQVYIG